MTPDMFLTNKEMFFARSDRKGFTVRLYFVILGDGICVDFAAMKTVGGGS